MRRHPYGFQAFLGTLWRKKNRFSAICPYQGSAYISGITQQTKQALLDAPACPEPESPAEKQKPCGATTAGLSGTPDQNRTDNYPLGGGYYIHLTTGAYDVFGTNEQGHITTRSVFCQETARFRRRPAPRSVFRGGRNPAGTRRPTRAAGKYSPTAMWKGRRISPAPRLPARIQG